MPIGPSPRPAKAPIRDWIEPPIRWLTLMVFRAFHSTLRHPRLVLALTVVVFAAFTVLIRRMPTYFTMEDTLDPNLPSVAATKRMERDFKTGISLYVILSSVDGSPLGTPELCALRHWMRSGVHNLEVRAPVLAVTSPFSLTRPVVTDQAVWFPPLLATHCGLHEPEPALAYADSSKDIAPLLAGTPWQEQMAVAGGGGDLLVDVIFRDEDLERGKHFPVDTALAVDRSLQTTFAKMPNVRWRLAGPAAFRAYTKAASQGDLKVNFGIPLVLTLLFRLFYGSWVGGILITLAIATMRTLLLGTMALAGYHADPLSGTLVTLVALAAIEDFLFVTRFQLQHQANWRQCYQQFLIPSLLTSFTTILGFLSLTLSDISTIRDLGLWAAYGAFIQWVVVYFIVPCVQSVWPGARIWTKPRVGTLSRVVDRLVAGSLPRYCRRLILPALGVAMLTAPLLRIEDSLNNFFPSAHPLSQAATYLRESRHWDGALSVLVDHSVAKDQRDRLLATVAKLPAVAHIETGGAMLDFITQGTQGEVRELILRTAKVDDAYQRFFSLRGDERFNVYIRESSLAQIESVMAAVRTVCPPPACVAAGSLPVFVDFSREVTASLFTSFASSLVVVALFLAFYLWLHRQGHYVAVIASSMWGPVVMIAMMAILRLPINFVSCFFAAILVAMSGDNAVQYIYAAKRRPLLEGIEGRARGSLEITLCMIGIALLMLLSAFLPPRTLGVVLAIGLMVNLAGDLWILKLLLRPSGRSQAQAQAPCGGSQLPQPQPQ